MSRLWWSILGIAILASNSGCRSCAERSRFSSCRERCDTPTSRSAGFPQGQMTQQPRYSGNAMTTMPIVPQPYSNNSAPISSGFATYPQSIPTGMTSAPIFSAPTGYPTGGAASPGNELPLPSDYAPQSSASPTNSSGLPYPIPLTPVGLAK